MSTQDENEVMQLAMDLHTVLQKAMVATPYGAKPNSVASLLMPGQSINESDFYYLPDADNPEYDVKPESMSVLADNAQKLTTVYSVTGTRISGMYRNILTNTELKKSRELTEEEKQTLSEAERYIKENVEAYSNAKEAYDMASVEYWIEKNKKSRNSNEKKLKILLDKAALAWDAAGRQKYEHYQNVQRELLISSPAAYFEYGRKRMEVFESEGYPCTFLPSTWALENDTLSWNSMAFSAQEGSSKTSITQEEKTILRDEIYRKKDYVRVFLWFYRPVVREQRTQTEIKSFTETINNSMSFKSMKISCDLARVGIYREWMDLGVLAYQGGKISGMAAGAISTGVLSADNDGSMPGFPSALILAKNIEISMAVDESGASAFSQMIDKKGTPKNNFCCGSFEVNETSHVTINKKQQSEYNKSHEVVISCPGKQIIGFVNTLVPRYPVVSG